MSLQTLTIGIPPPLSSSFILTLPAEWKIYRGPRGQYFVRWDIVRRFVHEGRVDRGLFQGICLVVFPCPVSPILLRHLLPAHDVLFA